MASKNGPDEVQISAAEKSPSLATVYYFEHSSPSRKVLIALYEAKVEFDAVRIDLSARKQHERWYLQNINPRGEVPALAHDGKVIVESSCILEYINDKLTGKSQGQLFPKNEDLFAKTRHFMKLFDSVATFPLTYGAVIFHTENVTRTLRWPYCRPEVQNAYRTMIQTISSTLRQKSREVSDIPAGKILAEKADAFEKHIQPIFEDLQLYEVLLSNVECVLDEVEVELSNDTRLGPWLCGPTFTAADVSLTCLLLRLHQIGMDERMWKGAQRPCISIYQELAFKRPSIEKATEWNQHINEALEIQPSSDESSEDGARAAYFGMATAVVLGGIYAYRKWQKN